MTISTETKTLSCPVCSHAMNKKCDWLRHCKKCKFLFSTLSPGAGTGVEGLETLRRNNFLELIAKLEAHTSLKGKTLLEIGPSTGIFLDLAKEREMIVTGIEPEKEKAQIARHKGLNVIEGFFPDALPIGNKFDIIIFNDVFEHLENPVDAIQECEKHLLPGGFLVLNLPDSKGFLYQITKALAIIGYSAPFERLWQKNFASPHISYFNSTNLRMLVENNSQLKLILNDRLDSVSIEGLRPRIHASMKEPLASIAFVMMSIFCCVQKKLPSDILLQIYKMD